MKLVIDRFEGDFAILIDEEEKAYNVDKNLFKGNREGDVIVISFDKNETSRRKEKITNLANKLFKD